MYLKWWERKREEKDDGEGREDDRESLGIGVKGVFRRVDGRSRDGGRTSAEIVLSEVECDEVEEKE